MLRFRRGLQHILGLEQENSNVANQMELDPATFHFSRRTYIGLACL
jgi:hypothetical protein